MAGISMPNDWDEIVSFSEEPHATFSEIRDAKPDRAHRAMTAFLEAAYLQTVICKKAISRL